VEVEEEWGAAGEEETAIGDDEPWQPLEIAEIQYRAVMRRKQELLAVSS
jgi:hypothetical protein